MIRYNGGNKREHHVVFFFLLICTLILKNLQFGYSFSSSIPSFSIKPSFKRTKTHFDKAYRSIIAPSRLGDTVDDDESFFDGYDRFIESLGQQTTPKPNIGQKRSFPNTRSKRQRDVRNRNYTRDPLDDMSVEVDESKVYYLLSLRHQAQRKKDFAVADEIRDELNNVHGVYVWDQDRLWSTSPVSPSYRNARGSNQKNDGFGIYGHDYVQIGDGINPQVCAFTLEEIHELLAQRLQFKLLRQYDLADQVQTKLYDQGVRVHDRLKQFRADGGVFADVEGMVSNREYSQNQYSLTLPDKSVLDNIQTLVRARSDARVKLDYKLADSIRNELWNKFNVAVDDISRTWTVGGDFGPNAIFRWTDDGPVSTGKTQNKRDWRDQGAYTQSSYSKELDNPDEEEEVLNLICDRLEARRVKDFQIADYILDYLYEKYDISVDDRMRQWSIGGDFGANVSQLRTTSPTAPDGTLLSQPVRVYNRRGGKGQLSDKELKLIDAMIQRRAEEMSRFNNKAAESIKTGLHKKFYVIIDDFNHSWHIRGNDYCLSPLFKGDLPPPIEKARNEIEKLIRERVQAREEKDFHRADSIRLDLFNTYGIKIDDRVKEWTIVSTKSKKTDNILMDRHKDDNSNDNESDTTVRNIQKIEKTDENSEDSPSNDYIFTLEDLDVLTVPKLKDLLRKYGQPVGGRKAELIQRLLEIKN